MEEITTTVGLPVFIGSPRRRKKKKREQVQDGTGLSHLALALAEYGVPHESIMELAAEGKLIDEALTQYMKSRGYDVDRG